MRGHRLGRALAADRKRAGLRQVDLAAEGCSPATVSAIETGRNVPGVTTLDGITERLGKPAGHYYPLLLQVQEHENALVELSESARGCGRHRLSLLAAGKAIGLAFIKRPANHEARALAYVQIGMTLREMEANRRAVSVLEKATRFGAAKKTWAACAEACYQISRWALYAGRWTEAHRQALMAEHYIRLSGGSPPDLHARVLRALARSLRELRMIEEATEVYRRSVERAGELGDARGEAAAKVGLGLAYLSGGRPTQAIGAFHDALERYEELGEQGELATLYLNLSLAYESLDPKERWKHLDRALRLYRERTAEMPNAGYLLNEVGRALLEKGDLDAGETACDEALSALTEPYQRGERALTFRLLGSIARQRSDLQKAHEHLRTSMELLQNTPDERERAATLAELARLWQGSGDMNRALASLQEGIDALSKATMADFNGREELP